MTPTLRPFHEADLPALVELSLRAWAPVFASVERQLAGSGVFEAQHPDWRRDQRAAVEGACGDPGLRVWVAEIEGCVGGFVAVGRRGEEAIGEIHMVAVAPERQRRGVGRALVDVALGWVAEQGLATAMVETAGDPGHAPARGLYESVGFTPFPVVRYFRTVRRLDGGPSDLL